jgi:polyisoprenyl-teichoic acid--peptidoglycan teichoic acid transferase
VYSPPNPPDGPLDQPDLAPELDAEETQRLVSPRGGFLDAESSETNGPETDGRELDGDFDEAFDDPDGPPALRSRYVPAFLDAVIPGLGHLVTGRWQRAILFFSPLLIMVLAGLFVVATTSAPRLAATLLSVEVIWGLLAAQALLLASRLLAVGSSLFDPALPRPGRGDLLPVALLLAFVIAPQAWAGYATEVAREAADQIFVEPVVVAAPSASPAPDPSFLASAPPSASPSPSVNPTGERITGLLIGVDAGVGRNTYLTDTMIVVSLDLGTRTVSMLSIPRDMVDVPLPDGRTYRDKVNSLVSYARRNPAAFPGSDGTGFDVLMDALGTLLNVPIDYYATVNLGGFVRVVDTLGGVDVNVARAFCDPTYDEYGFTRGFSIKAGLHHLNGQQALAYARVRKASGESDFTRAARQQEVISGIRDAIVGGGFLNDPIGLLEAIGETVQTNVPRQLLPDLAELAGEVGRAQTYRTVVNHPLVDSGFDVRGSIQIPDVDAIRELAAALFPIDGSLPDDSYALVKPTAGASPGASPTASPATPSGSGVGGCAAAPRPRPTPTPEPTPTPVPAPSATVDPSAGAEPSPTGEPSAAPSPTPAPTPEAQPPAASPAASPAAP